jgi:glycosyltransferase involved in cell wall biosynthesis
MKMATTRGDPHKLLLPISVVIPLYNHEEYIGQCLRSIADAAEQPQEIILVDNGSTDRSIAVAEALALPNLVIIRNDRNLGASRARTIGARAARHDLICFIDSDDFLGEAALAAAYAALRANDLDYCVFELMRVSQDGSETWLETPSPRGIIDGAQAFELTLGVWQIFSMGILHKRIYLDAVDDFEYHGHADDELIVRETFLRAKRIGGTTGRYFYRHVPKPYTTERVIGQITTNVAVLEMASRSRELLSTDAPLRHMRNVVTRDLLGLALRVLRGSGRSGELRQLYQQYRRVRVRWAFGDLPYWVMRMVLPALVRQTKPS